MSSETQVSSDSEYEEEERKRTKGKSRKQNIVLMMEDHKTEEDERLTFRTEQVGELRGFAQPLRQLVCHCAKG